MEKKDKEIIVVQHLEDKVVLVLIWDLVLIILKSLFKVAQIKRIMEQYKVLQVS
jgi:hypothetical protein